MGIDTQQRIFNDHVVACIAPLRSGLVQRRTRRWLSLANSLMGSIHSCTCSMLRGAVSSRTHPANMGAINPARGRRCAECELASQLETRLRPRGAVQPPEAAHAKVANIVAGARALAANLARVAVAAGGHGEKECVGRICARGINVPFCDVSLSSPLRCRVEASPRSTLGRIIYDLVWMPARRGAPRVCGSAKSHKTLLCSSAQRHGREVPAVAGAEDTAKGTRHAMAVPCDGRQMCADRGYLVTKLDLEETLADFGTIMLAAGFTLILMHVVSESRSMSVPARSSLNFIVQHYGDPTGANSAGHRNDSWRDRKTLCVLPGGQEDRHQADWRVCAARFLHAKRR